MRRCLFTLLALFAGPLAFGCGGPGAESPSRPAMATQWLDRARSSYRAGDFDDARDAARQGLAASGSDPDIRELAARIALVRLDYEGALRFSEGLTSSDAHGIRGRAYWFSGDIEHAADELEAMLTDPKVKDAWARDVAGLARRGAGRHPFEIDGGLVASVDMPRALDRVALGAANVVPCELDGERILALVATGSSEVLLDSNSRREPAWVSLRFDRLEVKDVPALVSDLAPITRQLGVPIKALLGAQFLRHTHATFDRHGDQFVVRRLDAAPPPDASRVPLYYVRGGGMLLRAGLTTRDDAPIPLLVDSSRPYPLLLEDSAWKKAGIDAHTLAPLPDEPSVKRGTIPTFRMGGFDLAKTPALAASGLGDLAENVDVDLGGVVGSELLAFFRVTFADEGRFVWLEADSTLLGPASPAPTPSGTHAPPSGAGIGSGPASPPAPSSAPAPKAGSAPAAPGSAPAPGSVPAPASVPRPTAAPPAPSGLPSPPPPPGEARPPAGDQGRSAPQASAPSP